MPVGQYIAPWKRIKQAPPEGQTGRPLALDKLLEMAGATPTAATGSVTEERPLGGTGVLAEFPGIKGEVGIEALPEGFKYDEKAEEKASLDLLQSQFGLSDKEISTMRSERTGKEIVRLVGEVLVLKGLPTATAGFKALETAPPVAKYIGRTALAPIVGAEKVISAPFKLARAEFDVLLDAGLDKWIATQGRNPDFQSALGKFLVGKRTRMIEYATNNLKRRMSEKTATPQAVKTAVDDTIKQVEKELLPEFTKTRTDLTIKGIKEGAYEPAPSIQAVKGVEMRLGKPAEIRKTLPTRTDTDTLNIVQQQAKKKGMDVEAVQGISDDEYWVGISLPSLTSNPAFSDWLVTLRNKDPEIANRVERLLVGKFEFTGETSVEPFGRKRFIPFKNIEDAQDFINGDISKIATELRLKGPSRGVEPVPKAVKGVTAELKPTPDAEKLWGKRQPLARKLESEPDNPSLLSDLGVVEIELAKLGKIPIGQAKESIKAARLFWEERYKPPEGKGDYWSEDMERRIIASEKALSEYTKLTPEVVPTPPVAGVTPVKPVGEVVTPTAPIISPVESVAKPPPPPTAPPPETGIITEVPISDKASFANLQDIQTVINYSNKPDVSRWIANLPLVKQVMSRLNPSAIANTPGEKAIVARAVLREEGTQKAQGVMAYLHELGSQEKVFGKLDDNGFLTSGELKGKSLNDVRTYPKRYKLTTEQKAWIDRAHEIEAAKLKFMRDNDININELSFEEGGEYAGRRVYAKMSSDGELLDSGYVGAGPARIGKKTAFEKGRTFKTVQEALEAGYKYLPEDEALSLNTRAAYNRVADKKMSEWLLTQVPWRTSGASEELVLAAESAKTRVNSSKQLLAALNRVVRGERIPDATITSIARTYPQEAAELKSLIPEIQANKPTASRVQALTKKAKALVKSDKADSNAAINARARARERAMTPKFGEASLQHPAFSGKIFTGPEAKQLAETMRNALEPNVTKALTDVNKVNALVRYFKLAGDFSTLGIQLIFLAGQNPRIYGGAAASIPKILLDKEWSAKFLSKQKATIDRHPGLLLSSLGTEFTEAMAKGGLLSSKVNVFPKQEALAKKLALVTPRAIGKSAATVLEPFQRVFEGTVDYAGIKMAEALEHLAKTPAEMAEVDQFINEFRGLTSSAKLGVGPNWRAGETATILAPRYNRAIAALLYDASKGAATFGQSGLRNRLAIQGLTKGIAAIAAMTVAISLALGEDEDDIKKHFDPLSPKFFTWNVAGQNIGPGSKVRSVVKLIAQATDNPEALLQLSMDNPALRFIRGNLAPVPGGALSILTGKNYIGDPVRSDVATFTREMIVKNFMMIWAENVIYEGGSISQRLIRGAGEFFGGRAYPETESDEVSRLRDRYSAQEYGKEWEDLNNEGRDAVRDKYPNLVELEKSAKESYSEKGNDIERFYFNEKQRITDDRNNSLEKAAQSYLDGNISKYDYDNQRGYIRPYYSGGSEVLWSVKESLDAYSVKQMEKWLDENIKPEDKALGEYQQYRGELIEGADLPVDWDSIDRELEDYLTKYSTETKNYILTNMNSWVNDLPPAAKQVELDRTKGIVTGSWWWKYREKMRPLRTTTPSTQSSKRIAPWKKQ